MPGTHLKTSSLAIVAGYIFRTVELEIICTGCLDNFSTAKTNSPLLSQIAFQDRGGLRYPSVHFIFSLSVIQNFIEQAVKILPLTNVCKHLNSYIIPNLLQSSVLKCYLPKHKERRLSKYV